MKLKINKLQHNPVSIEENNYEKYIEYRENMTYLRKEIHVDINDNTIISNHTINLKNTRKSLNDNKSKSCNNISRTNDNTLDQHIKHHKKMLSFGNNKEKLKDYLYVGNEYNNHYHKNG
ncbi:hypothetical protein Klosneuvirus_1_264 [Klosneuvirus KNV1]|uniref:Uncharacterized protein n=1 Tax=Klosneuvirus KNV1 TaxID=1977640 RepID=A0A1V0SI68_9VIRU|nr:hypothetical protein Klosneuvirus_1_264 [Klosneuvirus KNV1]